MTVKHTPGPWVYARKDNHDRAMWPLRIEESETGACVLTEAVGRATANARLIAAAPDLYAALKALVFDSRNEEAGLMARLALKKAEGFYG